jgi:CMP-N-acetylneuraminic acid synthetase
VVEHAIGWAKAHRGVTDADVLLLLQPTSPLRTASDLRNAIGVFLASRAPALQSVCPAKPRPTLARKISPSGILEPYFDGQAFGIPRHVAEPGYYENGAIFLNRIGPLLESRIFQVPGSVAYVMPPERSIDIDSAFDFEIAGHLLALSSENPPRSL